MRRKETKKEPGRGWTSIWARAPLLTTTLGGTCSQGGGKTFFGKEKPHEKSLAEKKGEGLGNAGGGVHLL